MNAVIFCPNIDGHRQIYCSVITDWLIQNGYNVILAIGYGDDSDGGLKTPIIDALAKHEGVTIVDLGYTKGSHLVIGKWVKTLLDIENSFAPKWTMIPAGDEVRLSLKDLGYSKSIKVKRAIIFTELDKFYFRDYSHLQFYRKMKAYAGWLRWNIKEFIYFVHRMWEEIGVDIAFSTNPDFFRLPLSKRFDYLPEIYQGWDSIEITQDQQEIISQYIDEYRQFLTYHHNKHIIIYYGMWCARRGYDWLLKLVSEDDSTVFASCGRPSIDDEFQFNVSILRSHLKAENRIFEVELPFLPNNEFVEKLFDSCDYVLMPYNNVYALSGIVIQAAAYGKPVVVPDVGYLNSIVNKYGLGVVYKNDDYTDFIEKCHLIEKTHEKYENEVKQFSRNYEYEKIFGALSAAITNR